MATVKSALPGAEGKEPHGKLKGANLFVWLILVVGALVVAFPLYWMFATAVSVPCSTTRGRPPTST